MQPLSGDSGIGQVSHSRLMRERKGCEDCRLILSWADVGEYSFVSLATRGEVGELTDVLLLRRALGRAQPEDYVDWAVECLSDGLDGSNLQILAGLSVRFDRDDVERYFLLARGELGLGDAGEKPSPLATARLIRRAFDRGRIPPAEAVEMMADVYKSSDYREELLAPWNDMFEEMGDGEGYFYPHSALEPLDDAVRREWSLLDRALALTLPSGWLHQTRCKDCGHIGEVRIREPSLAETIMATIRRRPAWRRSVCARCGSMMLTSLGDPDARSAYLDSVETNGS